MKREQEKIPFERVSVIGYRNKMWTRSKSRKTHYCVGRPGGRCLIKKGQLAYRPIGEGGGVLRFHRLCVKHAQLRHTVIFQVDE